MIFILLFPIGYILTHYSVLVCNQIEKNPCPPFVINLTTQSTNNNTNTASEGTQKYTAINMPELLPCANTYGRELVGCMSCLSLQELQRTLLLMNSRALTYYFNQMTNPERVDLRNEFSPEQWKLISEKDPQFTKKIDDIATR